jgi:hypothetical protein
LSKADVQLIRWPCIAKKPAFMLIHEFMQRQTLLFSYLDSGYFHQKNGAANSAGEEQADLLFETQGTSVHIQRQT